MEVNNRSLIKIGHFLLTKEYCARDWIDTLEVVETKVILNKIVNAIVKHINNSGYDDYIIAGVDLVGTLLACNCNIQYCKISNREKQVGKFGYMYLYDVL